MSELFNLFINNLLPIILAAGAGYLLSILMDIDPRPISRLVFYIFSPCLIFTLLTESELSNGDILRTMSFAVILIAVIGTITWLAGSLMKLKRTVLAGVLLGSMFINAGNYGLPVVLFAFGENALSFASVFFVISAMLAFTMGVIIASMGSVSLGQALVNLLKIPSLYALLLALFFMYTGLQIPLPVDRTVTLLGDAAIPGMLILLGLQLRSISWVGQSKPIALAAVMRLVGGPIVALMLGRAFGLVGASRQAIVLQSAMPTAVLATVLSTEYETEPSLVTAIVFVTTLLSPFTLTPLLAYLGA
ncbi:AEC family transporter [Chloroflexota bacterium]